MKMKLSDYVAERLVEHPIRHVFMVTGGGAMHLNHSLGTHPKLECIFNHHEQACAMAAEAYYRLNRQLAVVNVTSGPGGTNAITGVYGAWVDSCGMIILSGQVKFETTVRSTHLPLRQYGDQELDIEALVRPITKYCVMVTEPNLIRFHLEKALYLAQTGRAGPCWLDIPLDVQAAVIDTEMLVGFDPALLVEPWKKIVLMDTASLVLTKIAQAKRPVVFAGTGIRLSGQYPAFLDLIEKLGIPVVTAWNAHDVLWDEHDLYIGRPGTVGDRAGNFAVQNADLLLILGSRLNIRQVSYHWQSFARQAYKIWVDIDQTELEKPNVKPDMPVHADLAVFLPFFESLVYAGPTQFHREWLEWCKERRRRFPTVLPSYWHSQRINPYCLMQKLFCELPAEQIVVAGNGSACVIGFQAAELKKGQRLWTNSGCASMGYDLPAAIGACKASGGKSIICLTGDGSMMMNIQELETIVGHQLPIKIFLLNNDGYRSISQTQNHFFQGREVGASKKSGLTLPDFEKIAFAFELNYQRAQTYQELECLITTALTEKNPGLYEIIVDEDQIFSPKLSAKRLPNGQIISAPLEDLSPFLSREELKENMLIDLLSD